jgi:hypothetical protein
MAPVLVRRRILRATEKMGATHLDVRNIQFTPFLTLCLLLLLYYIRYDYK